MDPFPPWAVVSSMALQPTFLLADPVPSLPAFFSYCFESLIPNDLDLYIAELDINNEGKSIDYRAQTLLGADLVHFPALDRTFGEDDALFRGLLGLPQEPAVIRLSVVATSFPDLALGEFAPSSTRQNRATLTV
jgi:hypothetical protein